MSFRSAMQSVLTRSRVTSRKIFSCSVSSTGHSVFPCIGGPAVQYSVSQEREEIGELGWKEWKEDFGSLFAEVICPQSGNMSSHDSDEGNEGSKIFPGLMFPAFRNWDRTRGSMAMQNGQVERKVKFCDVRRQSSGIISAQIFKSERFGRFLGHSFGRFASTTGATGVFQGLWNSGYLIRLLSSMPATADGRQVAVDGEQLDSLQAGLIEVDDAASGVASLSSSGALSEVAVAAADSSYPTAFVQYVIDGVHVCTGLPWWASIVVTTVAIRIFVLPIMVYQMKATARLTLMRPDLEKLTNHIKQSDYNPKVVEDNQIRMKALFRKHKTSPLSPILGAFIQAPIFMCFFFAVRNMAEKMDSFKEGGTMWFTDLSTPDSLFIMPVLSGTFFLLTIELGATDGMQGQPMLAKMKLGLRGLAVLLVPLTASFPKALFCYWLTANVCSIVQALVLKQPGVKAVLGIPDVSHLAKPADIPVVPVITFSQPPRLKGDTSVASSKQKRP